MNDTVYASQFDRQAEQAMIDNGFEPKFSSDVAQQLAQIVAAPDASNARDRRDLLWSSIDNATSKDLDQIEWAEQLGNGDIRVLVGIADVDVFIHKDSPIDRHAAKNTVTVYTESKIFPMLP